MLTITMSWFDALLFFPIPVGSYVVSVLLEPQSLSAWRVRLLGLTNSAY